jgi:pimeloyl-ACP methyl ester carboxylesterase
MALWGEFRDRLAAERTVVSFDPRGAGRSSPAPLGVTTRGMANDALAVLDHLQLGTAHVFGLSLGGMVASWMASTAPERVTALVLGSTMRRGLDLSRHGLVRALGMAKCLLQPTAAQAEVCLLHRVLSSRFRREHPAEVERLGALLRAGPASRLGLLGLAAAAARHDARVGLGGIRAPTLLLWGGLDSLLGPDAERELRQALPTAQWALLPDCGHDLSIERPLATAEYLNDFLRRIPPHPVAAR